MSVDRLGCEELRDGSVEDSRGGFELDKGIERRIEELCLRTNNPEDIGDLQLVSLKKALEKGLVGSREAEKIATYIWAVAVDKQLDD